MVQTVSSMDRRKPADALQTASDFWTGTCSLRCKPPTTCSPGRLSRSSRTWPRRCCRSSAVRQVAAELFTNVLIPAGKLLWNAFTTLLLPVLSDVAVWLRDNVPPAVQTLADFLTKTLFPALGKVYDFVSANLIPLLKVLAMC